MIRGKDEVTAETDVARAWMLMEGTIHIFALAQETLGLDSTMWQVLSTGMLRALWLLNDGPDFGPEPAKTSRREISTPPRRDPRPSIAQVFALIGVMVKFAYHARLELEKMGDASAARDQGHVCDVLREVVGHPARALRAWRLVSQSDLRLGLGITMALIAVGAAAVGAELVRAEDKQDVFDLIGEVHDGLQHLESAILRLLERVSAGCDPVRSARAFLGEVWG